MSMDVAMRRLAAEFLSVKEAAEVTGLSPWTWRAWAYKGKVASVKAGRRLLIPRAEIDRTLREGYRPAIES